MPNLPNISGVGCVVGRLVKGYALPDRTLVAVKVSAIVVRKPQVPEDQNRARPKVDERETVLWDLTFEYTFEPALRAAVAASSRQPARVPLEPVVTVVMPPAQQGKGAAGQIGKREQRPEPLRLPHVNALMRSRSLEAIRIPAEHDMPERHRVRVHGRHAQEQASNPPVTFEDTGVPPCPPAGKEQQGHGQEPESVTGEAQR